MQGPWSGIVSNLRDTVGRDSRQTCGRAGLLERLLEREPKHMHWFL